MNQNVLKLGSKKLSNENWEVYHPNGKLMFICGRSKADYYLREDLANLIDKFKIKLTFTPKGEGFYPDDDFGLSKRIVRCVVSNATESLQRHHIVPYCFRKHFPIEYKSKNHHDVVLLHYEIHQEYEKHANIFKDELFDYYKIEKSGVNN